MASYTARAAKRTPPGFRLGPSYASATGPIRAKLFECDRAAAVGIEVPSATRCSTSVAS
jgi:hypothetical protein